MSHKILEELKKDVEQFGYKYDRYKVLTDLFEVSAIVISNRFDGRPEVWDRREKRFIQIMKGYDLSDRRKIVESFQKIFELLTSMIHSGYDDYLGKLYMMSGTSNDKTGQFFTPYCVSQACAALSLSPEYVEEQLKEKPYITFLEPTCGSGGMMLAILETLNKFGVNYSEKVFMDCSDIDTRCVHMCYLQLSLAGVPAVVRHQDTIQMKCYDEWYTPALLMQWNRFRPEIVVSENQYEK